MTSPSSGLQTMAPHRGVIFVLANCMSIVAAECRTIPSDEAVVLAGLQDTSPSQPAVSSGWRRAARGLQSPTYTSTSQPVAPQKSDETVSGSKVSSLNDELNQLKADRESLKEVKARVTSEPDPTEDSTSDRASELRSKIKDLLEKLNQRFTEEDQPSERSLPTRKSAAQQSKDDQSADTPTTAGQANSTGNLDVQGKGSSEGTVDRLALARVLIRTGDYNNSLKNLQAVPTGELNEDERLMVQYLTATCLRKLGSTKEATLMYREIANSKRDELLADCARWHLGSLRWREETTAQLDLLRQRRQALEKKR